LANVGMSQFGHLGNFDFIFVNVLLEEATYLWSPKNSLVATHAKPSARALASRERRVRRLGEIG
jgi:hypothetical protein